MSHVGLFTTRFRRRALTMAGGATLILSLAATGGAVASASPSSSSSTSAPSSAPSAPGGVSASVGRSNSFSPQVTRTGTGPTGYTVTFRYRDPTATSVQIKGEWYFSSPSQTTGSSSQGLTPAQWAPGDFPIAHPNQLAANWPVVNMTKGSDGVWTYTTPLPSGIFTYGFFVNCSSPTQSGCTEVSDPANPPFNTRHGMTQGSVEPTSQVYVPSDPAFNSVNYWWQAPASMHGTVADATYPSPLSTSPAGQNYVAVYTPPGYNPNRAMPYPTLYLSHGGGGNEADWITQGGAGNILDNLINTGQIPPMVVVMPSFNGYGGGCGSPSWYTAYNQNLVNVVIPWVQKHYDVSSAAMQRAYAGLSCGGGLASSLLINDTSSFGYFGVMSPIPPTPTGLSPTQIAAMKKVGILVGGGWQDPIHFFAVNDVTALQQQGIGVTADFINGGHEWYVWRILLKDFLTRVAFFPVVG